MQNSALQLAGSPKNGCLKQPSGCRHLQVLVNNLSGCNDAKEDDTALGNDAYTGHVHNVAHCGLVGENNFSVLCALAENIINPAVKSDLADKRVFQTVSGLENDLLSTTFTRPALRCSVQ